MGVVVAGGKNLICDMICRAFSADSAKAALKSLPAAGKDALKRAAERGYESSGARLATHHAEKMASLETRKAAAEAGETVVKDAAKETAGKTGQAAATETAEKGAAKTVAAETGEATVRDAGGNAVKAAAGDAAEKGGSNVLGTAQKVGHAVSEHTPKFVKNTLKKAAVASGVGFTGLTAANMVIGGKDLDDAVAASCGQIGAVVDGAGQVVGGFQQAAQTAEQEQADKQRHEQIEQQRRSGKPVSAEDQAWDDQYVQQQAQKESQNNMLQKLLSGDIMGALGDFVGTAGGKMALGGLAAVLVGSLTGNGIISTIGKVLVPVGLIDTFTGGKLTEGIGNLLSGGNEKASEVLSAEQSTVIPVTDEQVQAALADGGAEDGYEEGAVPYDTGEEAGAEVPDGAETGPEPEVYA